MWNTTRVLGSNTRANVTLVASIFSFNLAVVSASRCPEQSVVRYPTGNLFNLRSNETLSPIFVCSRIGKIKGDRRLKGTYIFFPSRKRGTSPLIALGIVFLGASRWPPQIVIRYSPQALCHPMLPHRHSLTHLPRVRGIDGYSLSWPA